jgi:hypothetical protein
MLSTGRVSLLFLLAISAIWIGNRDVCFCTFDMHGTCRLIKVVRVLPMANSKRYYMNDCPHCDTSL